MNPFSSATELARAVRTREVSPLELAELYLERLDRHDPAVNAVIWRDDEALRAAARRAERAVTDGADLPPFHGVPLPIKDLTQVCGQPATYGSRAVGDAPRQNTEPVVRRLLDAGFLLMGRTNTPEMGLLSTTDNHRYGHTRNPWNLDHSPGGSSGGAAAAVAAGLAPVAHANDGGGSIRMPASACGLVGLKPSRGRVPQEVMHWEHATVEGAITRYTLDVAALLDVLSVPDPLTMYRAPAPERPFREEVGREGSSLRIGLLTEAPTGLPVDGECVAAAEHTARLLESLGHVVEPVKPQFFTPEAIMGYALTILDASLWGAPFDDRARAEPHLQHRMARAVQRHSGEYVQAAERLQVEGRAIVSQWGRDFDVLLTPTMACLPPRVGSVLDEANAHPDELRVTETQMISFTSFCNVTGLPAVSVPTYTSKSGLPVGSQLVAGPFDEAVLVRLASALEEVAGWTTRRPEPFGSA